MNRIPFAERILLASTTLFLAVAPFTASAGWRAATLIAASASAAFLVARGALAVPRPLPRALLVALAAWCILAIASLAWSVDRALTFNELRAQLLYGLLAFGAFYVASDPARWRLWWKAMLACAFVLLAAEVSREHLEPLLGTREWDGGGGAFSTHLVILAPLLLPLAWPTEGGTRRPTLLFVLALVVLFYAAWRTENRIVWLAFLVAYGIAAIAHHFARECRPRFDGARYVAVAGVLAIVVLAGFTAHYRAPPADAGHVLPLAGIEADLRPKIWSLAIERIAEAPLLGHGYGREVLAPVFQGETPHYGNHPEVRHAHNVFLDVALQLGWIGEAIFIAILAILAIEFARALRRRETCPAGILGIAVLGGFVTKNLTDDFFYRQNGVVFWAVMGMLIGLTRLREAR
ncbi:hypothetical protein DSM104443_04232 [Usitatibacter rugosus]|uniref:O-antigen ligase-related domain-containing protein n=1 Tax=Usitatibacter rugosus TaxID=2732067 RepID=A0A6M4H5E2_9PROT|nr:O-antigen ligase family protein [Usitatibacter rugosus]QJR13137.1 hypothetical protein DSM104443_04232 [Usitatibacter rugosus]